MREWKEKGMSVWEAGWYHGPDEKELRKAYLKVGDRWKTKANRSFLDVQVCAGISSEIEAEIAYA